MRSKIGRVNARTTDCYQDAYNGRDKAVNGSSRR